MFENMSKNRSNTNDSFRYPAIVNTVTVADSSTRSRCVHQLPRHAESGSLLHARGSGHTSDVSTPDFGDWVVYLNDGDWVACLAGELPTYKSRDQKPNSEACIAAAV